MQKALAKGNWLNKLSGKSSFTLKEKQKLTCAILFIQSILLYIYFHSNTYCLEIVLAGLSFSFGLFYPWKNESQQASSGKKPIRQITVIEVIEEAGKPARTIKRTKSYYDEDEKDIYL